MEAAAAVGLASAVVQLVDFSAKATRETASLIRNSKEAPDVIAKLLDLEKSNNQLNDNIIRLLAARSTLDQDEELVRDITQNLRTKIIALLEICKTLVVETRADGSKSVKSQIKVGFKVTLKRTGIEDKAKEIGQIQGQLSVAFLHLIQ
jgi:hypothetical protein